MLMAWTCSARYKKTGDSFRESWKFWDKTYPLCRYLENLPGKKVPIYIFGHNIFFDLQCSDFFHYFTLWGWELEFLYESQLTYILLIKKEGRTIKVLSTTNFFDTSVKNLGKIIDLPKLDVDFKEVDLEKLKIYCRRDVEIIKKAMEFYFTFILKNDLGKFSLTRASQAFNAYRHRFMSARLYIHDDIKVKKLERDAYYGGRTEAFKIGVQKEGPFVSLDVNSMYPFIMKFSYMPVQLVNYREDVFLDLAQDILKNFCVVADIDVATETPLYPVRRDFKIIFPVGRFNTRVCTQGLREALNRGHVLKINRMAIYKKRRIFQSYVEFFYALKSHYRQVNQPILEKLVKIFLNSLYGKFAQKRMIDRRERDVTLDGYYRIETVNLNTGEKTMEYKLFNTHVIELGWEDGRNSFTAVAAHVSEGARLYLWRIIEDVGLSHVLYCDTDSIKIRKSDLPFLSYPVDDLKIGALKIDDEFDEFNILGAKSYITEKERVLKGVPHSAEMIEDKVFAYTAFLKQASHMKREITRYFITSDTIKVLKTEYDKGLVDKQGNVTPYRLSDV